MIFFQKLIFKYTLLLLLAIVIGACQNNQIKPKKEKESIKPDKQNPVSQSEIWRFVAFGDCRGHSSDDPVNVSVLQKLVNEIIKQNVDLVMFTGDICYGHANRKELGDEGALIDLKKQMLLFRNTIEPLYDNNIKVYIVRGNHETTQRYPDLPGTANHRPIWPKTKEIWDNVFSGKYSMPQNGPEQEKNVTFFVNHKNALIVGLDLYTSRDSLVNKNGSIPKPSTKRVDQKWLNQILNTNKKPHVFAFTHEPAFKVDHHDCMHGDDSYGLDYTKYRNQFWKNIKEAGSKVYFCGHDHGYALAEINNDKRESIYQVVVGTAGAGKSITPNYDGYNNPYTIQPLDQSQSYGFVIGEIQGDHASIVYRYINEKGEFQNRKALKYQAKSIKIKTEK
ncbi:metallophosphoesterase family protein [Aquimarina algiphila]|uniref:metallophosphoesterase family protein n=1 Tax=Aquimarina algiphila TaxID=2047982 RepID=UPI00232B0728|nr:metallophosphoesterase [Aquimarina algiphila]